MRDIRLLSNRVRANSPTDLDPDRYNFLNLENAEPNLGVPGADNGIAASNADGTRKWLATGNGLTVDVTDNLIGDETTFPIDTTGYRHSTETNLAGVLTDFDSQIGTPNWVRIDTNYNAQLGDSIIADTIGGSFTVTMPPSPVFGDWIRLIDPNSWEVSPVTLDGNGSTIEGSATFLLDQENTSVDAVYDGTTWQLLITTGPRGYTGSQGPQGPIGYTGSQGIEGLAGGVSFIYVYDTDITLTDPGSGRISLDKDDFTLAGGLAINHLNINGVDISDFLQTVDDSTTPVKGHVTLTSRTDRERFAIFEINGTNTTPSANHTVIAVNYVEGVTSFIEDEEVIVSFVRTGDRGYAGSQGVLGFTGSRGFSVTDDSLNGDGSQANPLSVAKLATPVDITIDGEVAGTSSFDGSTDITITTTANQVTEITASLTLVDSWVDTGISATDLDTGTYIVQVYLNDTSINGSNNNEYVSGIMSWYNGTTNPDPTFSTDEIPLHRSGSRTTASVFLRTFRSSQASGEGIKLQILSTEPNTLASNYVFKFRKIL